MPRSRVSLESVPRTDFALSLGTPPISQNTTGFFTVPFSHFTETHRFSLHFTETHRDSTDFTVFHRSIRNVQNPRKYGFSPRGVPWAILTKKYIPAPPSSRGRFEATELRLAELESRRFYRLGLCRFCRVKAQRVPTCRRNLQHL